MPAIQQLKTVALPPRRLIAGLRGLIIAAIALLEPRDSDPFGASARCAVILGMLLGQQCFAYWWAGRGRLAGPRWSAARLVGELALTGLAISLCGDDLGNFFLLLLLIVVEATLLLAPAGAWRVALWGIVVLALSRAGAAWHRGLPWQSHDLLELAIQAGLLCVVTAISGSISATWRAETEHFSHLTLLDELSLLLADPRQLDDVLGRLVELVPPALRVQACVVAVDEPGSERRIWANLGADTSALIDEALLSREALATLRGERRGILRYDPGSATYAVIYLLPLEIDERAGGLLSVARVIPEPFGPRDQSLFESLGRHAAQAVRNARLHRLEAQAMEASRQMEQFKSEMLAGVSHEFRLPLASISLAAESLLNQRADVDPRDTEVRLLRNIQRGAVRLSGFVRDLLDLARIEANQLDLRHQPCDLAHVTRTVFAQMEYLFEMKGQRVTLEIAVVAAPLIGDTQRLEQVISNLLVNAHQYTPEGGAITVALVPAEHALAEGSHALGITGRAVALRVSDSGPGVPAEERERIFERFGRGGAGRQRSGGTGLGLYIARSVVERHGGRVWVGEHGGGATFWCVLPLAVAEANEDGAFPSLPLVGDVDSVRTV